MGFFHWSSKDCTGKVRSTSYCDSLLLRSCCIPILQSQGAFGGICEQVFPFLISDQALLDNGATADTGDADGRTALMCAVDGGRSQVAKVVSPVQTILVLTREYTLK